jgi:hypothetical protein
MSRLFVPAGQVITRAGACITDAASGSTGLVGFALYDDAGTLITSTVTDTALFETAGYRFKSFPSPVAAQGSDRFVWLRINVEDATARPYCAFTVIYSATVVDGGLTSHRRCIGNSAVSSWPSSFNPSTDGSDTGGYVPLIGLG